MWGASEAEQQKAAKKAARKEKAKKLMMMSPEIREAHELLDEKQEELHALKNPDKKAIDVAERAVAAKKAQLDAAKANKDKDATKDAQEALKEAEADLKEKATIDPKKVKAATAAVTAAEKQLAKLETIKQLDEARKLSLAFLKYQQTPWTLAPLAKVKKGETPPDESTRMTELEVIAKKRVEAAQEALHLANNPPPDKVNEAKRVVEEKEAEVEAAKNPPQDAVTEAEAAVTEAKAAEQAAKDAEAEAKGSPDAKGKEGKQAIKDKGAAVKEASKAVKDAEAAVKKAQKDCAPDKAAIKKAEAAVKDAEKEVKKEETAVANPDKKVIKAAEAELKEAESDVEYAMKMKPMGVAVAKAQEALDEAKSRREAAGKDKKKKKEADAEIKECEKALQAAKKAAAPDPKRVAAAKKAAKKAEKAWVAGGGKKPKKEKKLDPMTERLKREQENLKARLAVVESEIKRSMNRMALANAIREPVEFKVIGVEELDEIFIDADFIANTAIELTNTLITVQEKVKEAIATALGAYFLKTKVAKGRTSFYVVCFEEDGSMNVVAQALGAGTLHVSSRKKFNDSTKIIVPSMLEHVVTAQQVLNEKMSDARRVGMPMELRTHLGRVFLHKKKEAKDGEEEEEEAYEPEEDPEFEQLKGVEEDEEEEEETKVVNVYKLPKKERKEVYATRRTLKKELQSACLEYNRAVFMLRGMLCNASIIGGVGGAVSALKDRMKEAVGVPINFSECMELDVSGLMEGEIDISFTMPEELGAALAGPALMRAINIFQGEFIDSIKQCGTDCAEAIGKCGEIVSKVSGVVSEMGMEKIKEYAAGMSPLEMVMLPVRMKDNVKTLAKVPFILKDLLKALKSMLIEILGVIRGKTIQAPTLAYLPGETCAPIRTGMQAEEEEEEEELSDDEEGGGDPTAPGA
jgi:hypothetical protein